jgi:demethylmenaquinone methyltransferase / 2-methoxy-6-polyprenyl-1,4-benzoquinol methylase
MADYKHDSITPYGKEADKKQQVESMFDGIAPKYDFLNHFLSLGTDILWRKIALYKIKNYTHNTMLDVATGTGDLAIAAARKFKPKSIIAVDISQGMLEIGKQKTIKANLGQTITYEIANSENLRFETGSFDTVMASFGVRNFADLEKGLTEMWRVLKPGGVMMVLEFSRPRIIGIKQIYNFYFQYILPFIGKLISKDNDAYKYLYESSSKFPCFEEFNNILHKIGFKESRYYPLSLGICTVYIGIK